MSKFERILDEIIEYLLELDRIYKYRSDRWVNLDRPLDVSMHTTKEIESSLEPMVERYPFSKDARFLLMKILDRKKLRYDLRDTDELIIEHPEFTLDFMGFAFLRSDIIEDTIRLKNSTSDRGANFVRNDRDKLFLLTDESMILLRLLGDFSIQILSDRGKCMIRIDISELVDEKSTQILQKLELIGSEKSTSSMSTQCDISIVMILISETDHEKCPTRSRTEKSTSSRSIKILS